MNIKFRNIVLSATLIFMTLISLKAHTGECVIDRFGLSTPPMTWNNGSRVGDAKVSSFGPGSCNVLPGSIIKEVRMSFSYDSKPSILTAGLIWGTYRFTLSTSGIQASNEAIVSGSGFRQIGTSAVFSEFNGLDLHNLTFSVLAQQTNLSVNLRCRHNNRSVCEKYMIAEYQVNIEYENASMVAPIPPTNVTASASQDDITISWSDVFNATYYNREVSLDDGITWTNQKQYFAPQTSVTFNNQQPRTYKYRIRACNDAGCSGWRQSNSLVILPNSPGSVTATVINTNSINISWAAVTGATHYHREVSLDAGVSFTNQKTYNAPQTQVTFDNQQTRSYQYRVRSCAAVGCSAWTYSNNVTVN